MLFASILMLAACGPYPRDITGTLDDIERTHRFTVGMADMRDADRAAAGAFVKRLEHVTGAKATIVDGPTETQLALLEHDQLDLVIGEFAQDTPWGTEVAVLEPLKRRAAGVHQMGLSPVAANGENRWIALLEREIRDHGEDGR